MQVENYNEPFLQALQAYDDGRDLSNYDFNSDGFGPPVDDSNKRKLVYRHRIISEKYAKVHQNVIMLTFFDKCISTMRLLIDV